MELLTAPPPPAWGLYTDPLERWAYCPNVFTPDECKEIVRICSQYNMRDATVGGFNTDNNLVKTDIRESRVVFLAPIQDLQWVYRKLTDCVHVVNNAHFKFDLWGFSEALQFTEYVAPSGNYGFHTDRVVNGTIRKLSLVVQLTDETTYTGGDFEIMDASYPEKLPRTQGTVLLFPSYTLHRVTPVTEGTRYSMVGWITGKPFV
jgi:PKHD-type hydroxylase